MWRMGPVRVTTMAVNGTSATVTDSGVLVDGYSLNRLELIGATPGAAISLKFALLLAQRA